MSDLIFVSVMLQAEARLAARRQARYEARNIRMKELERKQREDQENAANQNNVYPGRKKSDITCFLCFTRATITKPMSLKESLDFKALTSGLKRSATGLSKKLLSHPSRTTRRARRGEQPEKFGRARCS